MSENPRPCHIVLGDALRELQEREMRLARLEQEARETKAAIKVLRKLLGGRKLEPLHGASQVQIADAPSKPSQPSKPAGELKARAIEVIRASLDPVSKDEISEKLRRPRGLTFALDGAIRSGELVMIGDSYGLPTPGPSAEDLAVANGAAHA